MILLLLSVSTEITQGYSAGEHASLKGPIRVPLTCPVPGLAQIRTAKCSAYMWPLHVVWPPDNTETSKRSDFTHSGSGPQAQTLLLIRRKLSCLLWPSLRSHTALFASCSISQNRHKPIQIQGDENYTPTIERVTKSHTVCKSMWDKRYCCDHLWATARISYFTDHFLSVSTHAQSNQFFLKMSRLSAVHRSLR